MNSNDIFVSLDIGTSNVKIIIGEIVNKSLNIIGVGNVKSEGLKKGSIVDIDKTVQSIKRAKEQAERMIDMEIHKVIVGIPAHNISLIDCHGVVAVSSENREITDEDVYRVTDAAQVISIPPDREIINIIKKQFIVDTQDEINDPRGMIGVRLELEGALAIGPRTLLLNILRCVEKAGLEIVDIVLQPLATGEIALSNDEKYLGTALIEIGGGSTTVSVFEDGFIKGTVTLPIGGDHITKDISVVLRTSTENAENIKLKHGLALYDLATEAEIFSVPIIGSDEKEEYNQKFLAEIIEARLVELFELVIYEIQKMGVEDLPGGFVLTGGTAMMQGLPELAQAIFQNRVRVAIPDYIGVREPQYTTAVGIIKYAYKNTRLQGKESETAVVPVEQQERKTAKAQANVNHTEPQQERKFSSKMKKFLGSFFE
ncbi:cell division protein FtsA [Pallidibacillus thermolactis]|jgi:cell division protein FtsA|uniref:cell division protein FtsA n=1 Tax=Pallidibacillus thermolactis TaxID=251051 RepID=UPI0021D87781|nr:cell division protein FtsA [Pallidibacillus thermolactis]MCU9600064.1 cell division protein FtsA [Pallidibacillus thermolactis subsp. kokeshiiformis]